MTKNNNRCRLLIAGRLSVAHLLLMAGLALALQGAHAQGQNRDTVQKPTRAVACPSGWRTPDGNTALCEPMGTLAPKIYAKKEKESCASGYYEAYRLWCSTKKP